MAIPFETMLYLIIFSIVVISKVFKVERTKGLLDQLYEQIELNFRLDKLNIQ